MKERTLASLGLWKTPQKEIDSFALMGLGEPGRTHGAEAGLLNVSSSPQGPNSSPAAPSQPEPPKRRTT